MYAHPTTLRSQRNSASSISSAHMQPSRAGDVPTAVHNLLLSTKRLQELLTLWSVGRASETEVSDVFVKIGTDFNTTVHAFAYHRIDLSDVHSVPGDLRTVLEQCLAEDPSPQILDIYMPDVRKVIYTLLKGLQSRQDAWKASSNARGYGYGPDGAR